MTQPLSDFSESGQLMPEYLQLPIWWKRTAQTTASGVYTASLYTGVAHLFRVISGVSFTPLEEIAYYVPTASVGFAAAIIADLSISPPCGPWNSWQWKDHVLSMVRLTTYPEFGACAVMGMALGGVSPEHIIPDGLQRVMWISSALAAATTVGCALCCCKRPSDHTTTFGPDH